MHQVDAPYSADSPVHYRICASGRVGDRWAGNFGAMQLEHIHIQSGMPDVPDADVTVLTGPVDDQAALLGAINLLYDLGLSLISVENIKPQPGSGEKR